MKDAANLLSAMQTVCRHGRGLPAREYGIAAKNRWWRDAALDAREAVRDLSSRRPRHAGWQCRGVRPQDRIARECRSAAGSVPQARRTIPRFRAARALRWRV